MEVHLVLPKSLEEYVEYIPVEILPDILVEVLVKHIHETDVMSTSQEQSLVDMLLDKLNAVQISPSVVHTEVRNSEDVVSTSEELEQPETPSPQRTIVIDLGGDEDDDDMGDLLELLK